MTDNFNAIDGGGLTKTFRSRDVGGVHAPEHISTSMVNMFQEGFTGSLSTKWVSTGSGITPSISGGVLSIVIGTTAGSWAELTSVDSFSVPMRVQFGIQTPTRSTNNHLFLELVSVDSNGTVDDDSRAGWALGGILSTTVTQGSYETQRGGLIPTTSSSSTITSTASYSIVEIEMGYDKTGFYSRVQDSTGARTQTYYRQSVMPDPSKKYKLRIRTINAAAWKSVTGAVSGTGSKIRLTVASHGYTTGNSVYVECLEGVLNTAALVRGWYTITTVDSNTFELDSTVFAGTYVTGSGRVAVAAAPTTKTYSLNYVSCLDHSEISAEIVGSRGSADASSAVPISIQGGAETHIGELGGNLKTVQVTPVVTASPDYAAGDSVGGVQTVASVLRVAGQTAYLTYTQLISKVQISVTLDAFIFNANPSASTTTDNGGFVLATADYAKLQGLVEITSAMWRNVGGSVYMAGLENRVPIYGAAGTDVYVVLVTRGAINLASTSDLLCAYTMDNN